MATWTNIAKSGAPTYTNKSKNSANYKNKMKMGKGYLLNQLTMTLAEMTLILNQFDAISYTNLIKH